MNRRGFLKGLGALVLAPAGLVAAREATKYTPLEDAPTAATGGVIPPGVLAYYDKVMLEKAKPPRFRRYAPLEPSLEPLIDSRYEEIVTLPATDDFGEGQEYTPFAFGFKFPAGAKLVERVERSSGREVKLIRVIPGTPPLDQRALLVFLG